MPGELSPPSESSRAELKYLVERQREEIQTINEVGKLLGSTADPKEVVRLVTSYLKDTFPVTLCAVLLLEQRLLHLVQFAKIAQMDSVAAIRQIWTIGDGVLDKVQESDFAQTIDDQSADSTQWSPTSVGYLRSSHLAPLSFNGKPIGRLGVFSAKADAFSKEDRHVIGIVADQLASALHNALLLNELKIADQKKNDLLAIISHELRIPLMAILEGSGLLLEGALGPLNAEQSDFLKTVQRNAQRLQGLIEKVELAAQLITGGLSYTFGKVDLEALLKKLESDFQPMAQAQQVALSFSRGSPSLSLTGDSKRLHQAIVQILENAIQATPQGGQVTVAVSDTTASMEICIADTGKGIPPEEMPRNFEQFFQVGGTDKRKTGGLGLGLFIAQKILAAHQGTLQLESQVEKGTRATLRLPKEVPPR